MNEEPSYDSVWPGEESIETLWKETGGVDSNGKMWLTPRMERIARKIQKDWECLN